MDIERYLSENLNEHRKGILGKTVPVGSMLIWTRVCDILVLLLTLLHNLRSVAHDPSSPPKFLVPETGTSKFAHVPCILVPDISGTRNLGGVRQCSIRQQKLGCT